MGYLFLFFFSFPIHARHEKKRKHVVCRGLSFVICYYRTSSNSVCISSSLHALSNDRLTGASLKEVVGGGCFKFFFSRNTKTKRKNEIKTKTKMCGDACETGSVDLGG